MLSTFASQAQFGGHSKVLFAYLLLFLLPLFAALLRAKPSYYPVFIGFCVAGRIGWGFPWE